MDYTAHYASPLGEILLASDGQALTGLWFAGQKYCAATLDALHTERELPIFGVTMRWLDLFFAGVRPYFAPPLYLRGTDFQRRVWTLLLEIPFGETRRQDSVEGVASARRIDRLAEGCGWDCNAQRANGTPLLAKRRDNFAADGFKTFRLEFVWRVDVDKLLEPRRKRTLRRGIEDDSHSVRRRDFCRRKVYAVRHLVVDGKDIGGCYFVRELRDVFWLERSTLKDRDMRHSSSVGDDGREI